MEWTRGHILGRGSSAVVSIANSRSGNIFAVKSTKLSQSEFLQREQKFLSVLSSPFLVGYKGYDITRENNNFVYNLFMEYMSGGTIIDTLREHGGVIKESMIAQYTKQIVQGLEYLHSGGIVHCDIKGHNILIGESGAKIADLGCAKWANQEATLGGTPMFMSPEVARGEEQSFPADIWALGCTIIEMVTGSTPWPDNVDDPLSILYRIAFSGELPEIPNYLSDQAKDFVSKCLRRDQTERWTAKDLLKHPFLEESKKEFQDLGVTRSPTSILDQYIWNAMEEEMESDHQAASSGSWNSEAVVDRIQRLSSNSGEADWRWEETWMTIRSNIGEDENSEREGRESCSGAGEEKIEEDEVDFLVSLDSNSSSNSVIGGNSSTTGRLLGSCNTCEGNTTNIGVGSFINLERRHSSTVSLLLDELFKFS